MTRRYHPTDVDSQESLAIFISHAQRTSFESVEYVSPSNTRQPKAKDGHKLLHRGQHRGKFLVGALASIVSVVAILALLALCRTSQRRLDFGGSVRRNLSDAEDEDRRSSIIDQCLDLEEELGLRPAASPPSEEADEAKARLVSMLHESASTFEQMRFIASRGLEGEAHPPPPKIPRLNESWASDRQVPTGAVPSHSSGMPIGGAVSALDADAWVEEESELVFGEGDHQWYTTGQEETPAPQHGGSTTLWRHPPFAEGETFIRPSSLFSFGRAHGGYDATRPDAWLGGSPANTDEQALQQMVVGTVSLHPKVGTSSAAFASASSLTVSSKPSPGVARSIARADVGEGSEIQSIQIKTAQVLRQQADGTSVASDALEGPVSAATARATTSGGVEPSWSKDIRQHPFVRLPVVNPENVQSHFTQIRVLPFDKKVDSPMEAYMAMRRLFAKPSLSAEDVNILMRRAKLLVAYAKHKLVRLGMKQAASNIFMRLSSLFMVFDHLVCTIELLGEKMDTDDWWPEFVQQFHTDYTFPEQARLKSSRVLNRLVNRLSSALAIYKQGRRPPLEDVIELKRAIISEAYNESQLANPQWQLWVQDDRQFLSSSSNVEHPSEEQAHGQREQKLP